MAKPELTPVDNGETATAATDDKKAARNLGPRPAYVLVNLPEGVSVNDVQIVEVTRKAEDALAAIDGKRATNYIRVMVK